MGHKLKCLTQVKCLTYVWTQLHSRRLVLWRESLLYSWKREKLELSFRFCCAIFGAFRFFVLPNLLFSISSRSDYRSIIPMCYEKAFGKKFSEYFLWCNCINVAYFWQNATYRGKDFQNYYRHCKMPVLWQKAACRKSVSATKHLTKWDQTIQTTTENKE